MWARLTFARRIETRKINKIDERTIIALAWAWPIATILLLWRLIAAYRKYLRFPHAIATVLLTQFLVLLLLIFELQLITWSY